MIMNTFPYPGLRPFTSNEADIFFGRETYSDQLLEKLSSSRFISVLGLSGCGKSSLVQAGLIAGLESGYLASTGSNWQILSLRPGNQPMQNLATALIALPELKNFFAKTLENAAYPSQEMIAQSIASRGPMGLVEILQTAPFSQKNNILILVDQFEEIFRYTKQKDLNERESFVTLLLNSAEQQKIPLYVVVTMRSDYIGDCSLFPGLPEMMDRGQFLTPRLTIEQLRVAIMGPAKVFGGNVDSLLIERLINEVGNDPDVLPVLQHCLMRMWSIAIKNRYASDENIILTLEDYEAIGGINQALSFHADEAFKELTLKQKDVAEILFRRITERGSDLRDKRHPVSIQEIASIAKIPAIDVITVAEKFRQPQRSFLMPTYPDELHADSVLDISHESLIRKWHRLTKWAENEADSAKVYTRLKETASLWKQGKAGLWRTPDLEQALQWQEKAKPTVEWAKRYGGNFDGVMEFLTASIEARAEQLRKEERMRYQELRRIRHQRTWAIAGLICALLLTGWALWERKTAEQASFLAEKRQHEAEVTRDLARKAQEEAEYTSSSFRQIVNASFGFLTETNQNEEFLNWVQETESMVKLEHALRLMIDMSESLSEEERAYWHTALPEMREEYKVKLLNILGTEFIDKEKKFNK